MLLLKHLGQLSTNPRDLAVRLKMNHFPELTSKNFFDNTLSSETTAICDS